MTDVVFVRPRADKPDFGLPAEGAERPRTAYWLRRIRDEDVDVVEGGAQASQQAHQGEAQPGPTAPSASPAQSAQQAPAAPQTEED